MKTLSIEVTDEEHTLLLDVARHLGQPSPESLLRRSVEGWISESRTRLALIEEGRRSGDEQGWIDGDEVLRELDTWLAEDGSAARVAAE